MEVSFSLVDLPTLIVAAAGIILSLSYVFREFFCSLDLGPDVEVMEGLSAWLRGWTPRGKGTVEQERIAIDIVLRDIETANREISRRDQITLVVGTILITSTFLILANAASLLRENGLGTELRLSLGVHAFASVGLFTIWLLILYDTAKRLNGLVFKRIRAMEQALTEFLQAPVAPPPPMNHQSPVIREGNREPFAFGTHSYLDMITENQTACWLRLRRSFWALVLLFLSSSWLMLWLISIIVTL
jgi:hypothetical protein